jgi:glutathione S-transferase
MATGSSVITFYTHPDCTDSHRIHIALKELNLAYEEKVVNPNELKEPWYLDLNPVLLLNNLLKYSSISNFKVIARRHTNAGLLRQRPNRVRHHSPLSLRRPSLTRSPMLNFTLGSTHSCSH